MKKIVALIVLGLGFTLSTYAQVDNKAQTKEVVKENLSPAEAAKKDAAAFAKFFDLNETREQDFQRLFQMKHKIMQDQNASFERKKEMVRIVSAKIAASIDSNQLEKLKANDALYKQMTGEDILK